MVWHFMGLEVGEELKTTRKQAWDPTWSPLPQLPVLGPKSRGQVRPGESDEVRKMRAIWDILLPHTYLIIIVISPSFTPRNFQTHCFFDVSFLYLWCAHLFRYFTRAAWNKENQKPWQLMLSLRSSQTKLVKQDRDEYGQMALNKRMGEK